MNFEVQILGSNSALAAHGRHPTAQVLKYGHQQFLIDCGEGTQMRLQRFKAKPFKIEHIFISHLHGDHYFGLIGLLTSYHLLRRSTPLTIYAPRQLEPIIKMQLEIANTVLNYPLHFKATQDQKPETILDTDFMSVTTIPLTHRIPCTGFLFTEKRLPRKISPEAVLNLNLNSQMYDELRMGNDITDLDGQFHPNHSLTAAAAPIRKYAYCTDTLYKPDIVPLIEGVDLLYHEATFSKENAVRAEQTFHSTTHEAATLAHKANVGELLIGHFSSKYLNLHELLTEAKEVFPKTKLALEGQSFSIGKAMSEQLLETQKN